MVLDDKMYSSVNAGRDVRIGEEVNEGFAICGLCTRVRNNTRSDVTASTLGLPLASVDFKRLLDAP